MQFLQTQLARAAREDRRRAAALRQLPPVPEPRGSGPPSARRAAVLAARLARRLDAEAARDVLRA